MRYKNRILPSGSLLIAFLFLILPAIREIEYLIPAGNDTEASIPATPQKEDNSEKKREIMLHRCPRRNPAVYSATEPTPARMRQRSTATYHNPDRPAKPAYIAIPLVL